MIQTVEALKALYKALGGEEADVAGMTLIPELIQEIASLVADGALKELPEVDAEDNGKVLKVVEGEWALGTDNTSATV